MLITLNITTLAIQLAAAAFAVRLAWRHRSWSWSALAASMLVLALVRAYRLTDYLLPWEPSLSVVEVMMFVASTAAVSGLAGIARDHSRAALEKTRAEQARQDSEQRYRTFVETSPDAVYIVHEDGRFVYLNKAAARLFGASSADELLGRISLNVYHSDDQAYIKERREQLYKGFKVPVREYRVKRADGSVIDVEGTPSLCMVDGRPAIQVVLHDLTERKRADRALRESEERLRTIMDNSPTAVFAKDLEGKYIFYNRQAQAWTGRQLEQVLGRNDFQLFDPTVAQALAAHDREAMAARGPAQFEERVPHADGIHTHLTSKFPLLDPTGQPYAICGISIDISDRKKVEEELRRSQEHYRQAAAYNERLLREVNHRVRNNLSSLLALVTLSRHRAGDPRESAAALESRVMAMAQVHNRLAQTGWRDMDLRGLLMDLLALLKGTAPHDVDVHIGGPPVLLRPQQALALALTLLEMFANSCKHGAHTSPYGSLAIAWTARPDSASGGTSIQLTWRESGGPRPSATPTPSLGTELIDGFITFELGGRYRLTYPPEGAFHQIEFIAGGKEHEVEPVPTPTWPTLNETPATQG